MRRIIWKARILEIIPNIEIISYDENIIKVNFSILEIL